MSPHSLWLGLQVAEDCGRGLVDTVMDLLGIAPGAIGENDDLAGMGIDSMQARSHLCCAAPQSLSDKPGCCL